MDWETVSTELQKPLSPDAVKPPPKGKFGEYVDALHVIREANRIFGENGWSYTVTRLEKVSEQILTLKGRDGTYEQARVGYLASVLVNIDGVQREGTAVGSGMGNPNSIADHHEAAVKEAETDALKRALRTFGNTFGLALYEKDLSKREVGPSTPAFDHMAAEQRILGAIRKQVDPDDLSDLWKAEKDTMKLLPDEQFETVKSAFSDAMHKLTTQQDAEEAA